jgi:hypothetical protein
MSKETYFQEWFSNPRRDIVAGAVVALALIPEAIAFSIIAGVDPKVGLYASFCIAVVIAIFRGRPGMISAATGAMALLMVTLVKDHGLQYLLAATLLTGVIQIIAGLAPHRGCHALCVEVRDDGLSSMRSPSSSSWRSCPEFKGAGADDVCDGRWPDWPSSTCCRDLTKAVPSPLVSPSS